MCERIQNWETVSQNWEKRVHWPARSFTLDDFRTTRADRVRSSPLSVALHPASVSRGTRRASVPPESDVGFTISPHPPRARVSARQEDPVLVPVSGASRDLSGAARWSVAHVRSLRATRCFVHPRSDARVILFPVFCERQCRSSRVHGCVAEPVRSDPARRHRATITTARHASKRNARRNTRYEGSSPWTPRWAARWRPRVPTPWTPTPNRLAGRISTVSEKMRYLILFFPSRLFSKNAILDRPRMRLGCMCITVFIFFFSTRVSRNALYFVYGAEAIQVRARILET